MIIDTHWHGSIRAFEQTFSYWSYRNGRFEIVENGNLDALEYAFTEANIIYTLEPSISPEFYDAMRRNAATNGGWFLAAGFHPTRCVHADWSERRKIADFAKERGVIAIGETGLDFHLPRKEQHRLRQLRWFLYQLWLAHRMKLPLVLHIRNADRQAIWILRLFRPWLHGGSVHCFRGNAKIARQYMKLGFCLGIGGLLLMGEESADLQEAVRAAPLRRLLLETDAPYVVPRTGLENQMSKKRLRRVRNTPLILPAVIEKIAELKEESSIEVERVMTANAEHVFNFSGVLAKYNEGIS